jgi:hypothetical protein
MISDVRARILARGWVMASGQGQRSDGAHRAAAALVLALVTVVAIGIAGKQVEVQVGAPPASASQAAPSPVAASQTTAPVAASAEVPDFLRHLWARPYAIHPDQDQWKSGFLELSTAFVDYGPAPGPEASQGALAAVGIDRLVVTATTLTKGCSIGDIGVYRWSIGGKGTVMTLEVVDADSCAGRQGAIAGPWVRSDFPVPT